MTGNHHLGIRPEAGHRPSDDAGDTSVTGRPVVQEPEPLAPFPPAALKEIRGCH